MSKLLFSTDTDSGTISVIDLTKEKIQNVSEIPVGNGPRGPVKFTKTGRGFVANHAGNTLSEIDAYSLGEVAKIDVGVAPIGCAIVPGDNFALTSITGNNTIAIVDIEKREKVGSCVVGREPRHMSNTPDGQYAYLAVSGGDYIAKLDISNLSKTEGKPKIKEMKRIYLGKNTTPYSVSISPDGNYALSANNQNFTNPKGICLNGILNYNQLKVINNTTGFAISVKPKSDILIKRGDTIGMFIILDNETLDLNIKNNCNYSASNLR